MVSIEWCLNQGKGIKLVEPNKNISDSYLKMAEESIRTLTNIKESRLWSATASYYIFYYSLYSLMVYIGIKCEIHNCTLKFMETFLKDFYNERDMEMIQKAFSVRTDLQYYTNRPVSEKDLEDVKKYCKEFYIKTKDIISKITETQIESIRKKLKDFYTKRCK